MTGVTQWRKSEIEILTALKDGKKRTFTELKTITKRSADSINESRKRLWEKKMIEQDFMSRKYFITPAGLNWIEKNDLARTITTGVVKEERWISPPISAIVAAEIPEMGGLEAQQVYAPGTPDIAKACFKQFLMDTLKARSPEIYQAGDPRNLLPTTGRVVYTAAIDWGQVAPWFDSADGKKYLKKTLKEVKEAS